MSHLGTHTSAICKEMNNVTSQCISQRNGWELFPKCYCGISDSLGPPTPSLVRMHKFHRKFYSPCTTSLSQVPTLEKLRTTGKRQPPALDTDFRQRLIRPAPYHSSIENHRELTAVILVSSPSACSVLSVTQDYNVPEQNCMLNSQEVPIANSKSPPKGRI